LNEQARNLKSKGRFQKRGSAESKQVNVVNHVPIFTFVVAYYGAKLTVQIEFMDAGEVGIWKDSRLDCAPVSSCPMQWRSLLHRESFTSAMS